MDVILIGNYKADNQYSMCVFEALMAEGYAKSKLEVRVFCPSSIFGKMGFANVSLVKWLAYIDKFIIFPLQLLVLRLKNYFLEKEIRYHICDHSNAFYLHFLPKAKTIISCHDVLAIRAGLGYTDTYCTPTKSGIILQRIILNALSGAKKLVAVSEFTLKQLESIDTKPYLNKNWISIHNSLSNNFQPMPKDQIQEVLEKNHLIKDKAIILHIGSDLERKNRKLLVKMIHQLQNDWDGILVFAGAALNADILDLIEYLRVTDRVVQINNPTDTEIIALYSCCHVMVFPSYSEGFGWPIIEAQACGAPVITSNKAPMMSEVGGEAALYANPDDASSFVNQFLKLNNKDFRDEVIRLGYENVKRFDFENTMNQYIEIIKK